MAAGELEIVSLADALAQEPTAGGLSQPRSTYWSTKLRESGETGTTSNGLRKPSLREQACLSPYRTQEVAGSSPASSISKRPVNELSLES
jgi:hypothetical protein